MNKYQEMFLANHPIAVECRTEFESWYFRKWAKEQGLTWNDGTDLLGKVYPQAHYFVHETWGIEWIKDMHTDETILPFRQFFAIAEILYPDWEKLPKEAKAVTVDGDGGTCLWGDAPVHFNNGRFFWMSPQGRMGLLSNAVPNCQDTLTIRPEMPAKLSPAEQMVADAERLLQQAREELRKEREAQ